MRDQWELDTSEFFSSSHSDFSLIIFAPTTPSTCPPVSSVYVQRTANEWMDLLTLGNSKVQKDGPALTRLRIFSFLLGPTNQTKKPPYPLSNSCSLIMLTEVSLFPSLSFSLSMKLCSKHREDGDYPCMYLSSLSFSFASPLVTLCPLAPSFS